MTQTARRQDGKTARRPVGATPASPVSPSAFRLPPPASRLLSVCRLCAILVLVLTAAPLASVQAQQTNEAAAPAAIPGLAVGRNDATSNFPNGITFTFDAQLTDPAANVELMYRPTGVKTYEVETPDFDAGATQLAVTDQVDLRAGELPPGLDVQYHWRITGANGDVVETPEQTVLWGDNRYTWTPLSGPHVTVYAYNADADFQQSILDTAERTVGRLATAYGAAPTQPIRIWAYANKDDLYGALAPNSEPWIAGANFPGLSLILAILPPGNTEEVLRVVPHEISHQVLHQATDNPFNSPPTWMDEGLAVYSQETGRDRFYSYALGLAASGNVPHLRSLNGNFAYDRQDAMAAYAFSLSAVKYILDTFGNDGMARLIATFPQGVSYDDAIQQGLGISFDELDRRWREDLIAKAKQGGASGSTVFHDDPGDSAPWSQIGSGSLLASGTLVLGIIAVIAVIAWIVRRPRMPREEPDEPSLRWREWPEELEPPGWQA
jgi:Peptidase MA superfamily